MIITHPSHPFNHWKPKTEAIIDPDCMDHSIDTYGNPMLDTRDKPWQNEKIVVEDVHLISYDHT